MDKKREFAKALLADPKNAFGAACVVSDDDSERFRISRDWPDDPEVRAYQREIMGVSENDEAAGLPSKAQFIQDLWARMIDCPDPDGYAKLAKMYADVRGYIQKPAESSTQHVVVTNKVMVVPQLPSEDAWEQEARRQQKMLIVAGEEVVDAPAQLN